MRDLPAAGRYWFLTERSGPEADAAFAAMHRAHRGAGPLLTVLPARARLKEYPTAARQRLQQLLDETPNDWLLRRKQMLLTEREPRPTPVSPATDALGTLIIGLILGLWLLGVGTAVYLIWKLGAALL